MAYNETQIKFVNIVEHLEYPTQKHQIIDAIRTEGNGDDVVMIAEQLDNRIYDSAKEVKKDVLLA